MHVLDRSDCRIESEVPHVLVAIGFGGADLLQEAGQPFIRRRVDPQDRQQEANQRRGKYLSSDGWRYDRLLIGACKIDDRDRPSQEAIDAESDHVAYETEDKCADKELGI